MDPRNPISVMMTVLVMQGIRRSASGGLKLEMVGFQPGWFQQDGFFHGLFLRG